ncbi:MAG: phosphoribosylglycinamide formyltransferase [Spirochaetales bacterium]|nr:phosphoribosylglycinamide formyltransferase [Spirochaetales bacterium]
MLRVAVLISGGGSNLQSLIDYSRSNSDAGYEITSVIADRPAGGLEKAEKAGIPAHLLDRKKGMESLADDIHRLIYGQVDYIVLAGFLSILDSLFIEKWNKRIINIHPALLPDFGGRGMYGMNVHRAVLASGAKESGCTVHYVDNGIDTGEIINQMSLEIDQNWSAEQLQKEVLKLEHILLPQTLQLLCDRGSET